MKWLVFALRRFVAPAVLAGYAANLAVYWQLGTEGGFTDWRSIGFLVAIAFTGFVVGTPEFLLIRRLALPGWVKALAVLMMGVALGAIGMALIALYVEAADTWGYTNLGVAAGVATAIVWLAINLDLMRNEAKR
jgi:hypothetical protein